MGPILSLLSHIRWPVVWTQAKLIGTAVGILYAGAHASLTRPPSAAPRKKVNKAGKEVPRDEDKRIMEGLKNSDALMFPLMAGMTLVTLYYLLQKYPDLVNKVLRIYVGILSIAGLATMYSHSLQLVTGFLMPRCVRAKDGLYTVRAIGEVESGTSSSESSLSDKDQPERDPVWNGRGGEKSQAASEGSQLVKASPRMAFVRYGSESDGPKLDRPLGPIPLPAPMSISSKLVDFLWDMRKFIRRKLALKIDLVGGTERVKFPVQHIIGGLAAVLTVWGYHMTNWTVLSNLIGLAGCYSSMLIISPTTYATGSLILIGLFFYDIIMVFYTVFMISVATSLDVPIKLTVGSGSTTNILGLGDIVVPGMMVGLALRFDLWMHYERKIREVDQPLKQESQDPDTGEITTAIKTQKTRQKATYQAATGAWGDLFWSKSWGELITGRRPTVRIPDYLEGMFFPKTYFHASIAGYTVGMLTTLGVLLWTKHGQPALLYLVPSVLGAIGLAGWVRGDLKELWRYTEDGSLDKEDVVVDVGPDGKKVETLTVETDDTSKEKEKEQPAGRNSSILSRDGLIFRVSLRVENISLAEDD